MNQPPIINKEISRNLPLSGYDCEMRTPNSSMSVKVLPEYVTSETVASDASLHYVSPAVPVE